MAKKNKPKYVVENRRLASPLQFVREWSSWSECQTQEEAERDYASLLEYNKTYRLTDWEQRIRKL